MKLTLTKLQKLAALPAPVIGISRPGEKPFAFERKRLAALIEGLEAADITLNGNLEICASHRRYVLHSQDVRWGSVTYKMLRSWAKRQRAKCEAPALPPEERQKAELLRKIAVAERKANRAFPCRPYNPALRHPYAVSGYEREEWAAWFAEKPMRRAIGKLAVEHGLLHGHFPHCILHHPRKLYSSLSALTNSRPQHYGGLRNRHRYEKPPIDAYLRHLYLYTGAGLASKPRVSDEWRAPEIIHQERLRYCQRMRDWRNAREAVNWLRSQLASFDNSQRGMQ